MKKKSLKLCLVMLLILTQLTSVQAQRIEAESESDVVDNSSTSEDVSQTSIPNDEDIVSIAPEGSKDIKDNKDEDKTVDLVDELKNNDIASIFKLYGIGPLAAGTAVRTISNNTPIELKNGYNIHATGTGQSAIAIKPGVNATIFIEGDVTLVGGPGNGNIGGGAGIEVPSNSTLKIKGKGKLVVKGGNAGSPANGAEGANSSGNNDGGNAGSGGNGGTGGGGAGAAIGGAGGNGGSGGRGADGFWSNGDRAGNAGQAGSKGAAGGGSGIVMVLGEIEVEATGGTSSKNTMSKTKSGYGSGSIGQTGGTLKSDKRCQTGGGGGASGNSGAISATIGGGGSGGGGGGGGGSGATHSSFSTGTTCGPGTGGGGSGAGGLYTSLGGNGGNTGMDVTAKADGAKGVDGGSGNQGTNGGSSGKGGSAGDVGGADDFNKLYSSANAVINRVDKSGDRGPGAGVVAPLKNKTLITLDDCDITLDQDEFTFKYGVEHKPKVTIRFKGTDTDIPTTGYEIVYSDPMNAGIPVARIQPKGVMDTTQYYVPDTVEVPYTIHKADDDFTIQTNKSTVTYGEDFILNAQGVENDNPIVVGWKILPESTGEAVITESGLKEETATIVPTKVGKLVIEATLPQSQNYNEMTEIFEIVIDKHDITLSQEIKFDGIPSQIYTSAKIQYHYPLGSVVYADNKDVMHKNLDESLEAIMKDYRLEWRTANINVTDNIKKATVTIIGEGNYTGERTFQFDIVPRDLSNDDTIVYEYNHTPEYTGHPILIKPEVKVTAIDGSLVTIPEDQYVLSYVDAQGGTDITNVGVKSVTITANGNLTGTRILDYEIVQADIEKTGIENLPPDVFFDGHEIESRPLPVNGKMGTLLTYFNLPLTEKIIGGEKDTVLNPHDYELVFTNHLLAGKATITIKGINNYKGEKVVNYEVKKRPLYILPDPNQGKLYGTKDTYGENNDQAVPPYTLFVNKLNDTSHLETKTRLTGSVAGYEPAFAGSLSRNLVNTIPGDQLGSYAFNLNKGNVDEFMLDPNEAVNNPNYEVRIINNENYYTIREFIVDDEAHLIGKIGKNNWYIEDTQVTAPTGYQISASNSLDGITNVFSNYVTYPDGNYDSKGVTYFLRRINDGAITTAKTAYYKQDTHDPKGNIILENDAYSLYKSSLLWEKFLNRSIEAQLYSRDETSGVIAYHMYIADKEMSNTELDALKYEYSKQPEGKVDWKLIDKSLLDINQLNKQKKIVYGRIEDAAGNVTYLNTDGIVFDKDKPILTATYEYDNVWTNMKNPVIKGNIRDETAGLKDRFVGFEIGEQPIKILEFDENGDFEINMLPDGDFKVKITAWDKADNQATPIIINVKKDTVHPRVLLNADTLTIAPQQQVNFTTYVGASKEGKFEVKFNDGEWETIKGGSKADFFAKENGTYSFRLTNGMGIVSDVVKVVFTKIDPIYPQLVVKAEDELERNVPNQGYSGKSVNVSVQNAANNLGTTRYEYSINGADFLAMTQDFDNTARIPLQVSEGKYDIIIRVTSQAGLVSEESFSFGIDKTNPAGNVIVKDKVSRSIFTNMSKIVELVGNDPVSNNVSSGIASVDHFILSGNKYFDIDTVPGTPKEIERVAKGKWKPGNETQVDPQNRYIVFFRVIDNAGNIGYVNSDDIVADNSQPHIEVIYDRLNQWDQSVDLDVRIIDELSDIDTVEYTIDDGAAIVVATPNFHIKDFIDGIHTVVITARDKSGNTARKEVAVKQDSTVPVIHAESIDNSATDTEIDIKVNVDPFNGPSGIDRIMLQKNNGIWEDVTKQIKGNLYTTNENGEHRFRVYSGAGAFGDAIVDIDLFAATNVTAKVIAINKDLDYYTQNTWTNEEITLHFSNEIANLKGLKHYMMQEDGSFNEVMATGGTYEVVVKSEGIHSFTYKVESTQTGKTDTLTFIVKIDKKAPTARLKMGVNEWFDDQSYMNGVTYDIYEKKMSTFHIIGSDTNVFGTTINPEVSGIERISYFVAQTKDIASMRSDLRYASEIEKLVNGSWIEGDTANLTSNKVYVIFGKIEDLAGNVHYVSSDGIIIDDISPSLEDEVDETIWYTENTQEILFTISDELSGLVLNSSDSSVKYSINGGNYITPFVTEDQFTISIGELSDRIDNLIHVEVVDASGNKTERNYTIKKDSIAPAIIAEDITPEGSTVVVSKRLLGVKDIHVGPSDVAKVEVRHPGYNLWVDITNTYQKGISIKENGTYYFRVQNKAGVYSPPYALVVGNIDSDVPILNYLAYVNEGLDYDWEFTNQDIYVKMVNEVEGMQGVRYYYSLDGGAKVEILPNELHQYIFKPIEGVHTYTIQLIKNGTVQSEMVDIVTKLDQTAPTYTINVQDSGWVQGKASIQVIGKDDLSGLHPAGFYSFDGGIHWTNNSVFEAGENRYVSVMVRDAVGNVSMEKVEINQIDKVAPTILEITQQQKRLQSVVVEKNITIQAVDYRDTLANLGSGIKEIYVSKDYPFDNGILLERGKDDISFKFDGTSWKSESSLSFEKTGDYIVWLVASDNVGNKSIYSTKLTEMTGSDPNQPVGPDKPGDITHIAGDYINVVKYYEIDGSKESVTRKKYRDSNEQNEKELAKFNKELEAWLKSQGKNNLLDEISEGEKESSNNKREGTMSNALLGTLMGLGLWWFPIILIIIMIVLLILNAIKKRENNDDDEKNKEN